MPIRLRKKVWIIPPFLYLNASNSGLSWTLKIGPWSRNSRTKRNRVDLPGPISWVGRTKGQRAAARKRREERRARRAEQQQQATNEWADRTLDRMLGAEQRRQERAKWDAYFRDKERRNGAAPGTEPTPEQQNGKRNGTRPAGTATAPRPEQSTQPASQARPPACAYCGNLIANGRCTHCGRGELCRQRTQDGSECRRPGKCPPGYHHPRRR